MKRIFGVIPILLSLALVAGLGWFFLVGQHLKIENVAVVLAPESEQNWLFQDIKKDLSPKLKNVMGQNFLKFSFADLAQKIMNDPRVKTVHLQREFPSSLRIEILPHDPVVGWVDERGFIHPVARDNKILPGLKSEQYQDYALLRGKEFKSNDELRQRALDLLEALPEQGAFRRSLISEIRFSKASGFEVFLSEPSVLVRLGENDITEKSARVEKVLSYLQNREINGRVIDSRFGKKVVVRVRNEP